VEERQAAPARGQQRPRDDAQQSDRDCRKEVTACPSPRLSHAAAVCRSLAESGRERLGADALFQLFVVWMKADGSL
jgi:hypothetical protein